MKKSTALLAVIKLCVVCSTAFAINLVANEGTWPASWPKELEPLRAQARSVEGGQLSWLSYQIPFAKRSQFEAAWPHLLKVKSKGAPIILVRGPYKHLGAVIEHGVVVHSPPAGTDKRANPETPLAGKWDRNVRKRWMWTTYIELVVDSKIVDLNRIELPADTPIIDERFEDAEAEK